MDVHAKKELMAIKKELDTCRHALDKWNSLIQKREELEFQIEKIKNSFKLEENKKLLESPSFLDLKKHLKELDHLLDYLEDYSHDRCEQLENMLIIKILSIDPDERTTYERIENSLMDIENKILTYKGIYEMIDIIDNLFQQIFNARQQVRRRGILSYIFGVNPNATISLHLHAIQKQIDYILPLIRESSSTSSVPFENEDLYSFFIKLQNECNNRWGFTKIDHYFVNAHGHLKQFSRKMKEQLQKHRSEKVEMIEHKEKWILKKLESEEPV